MGQAHKAPLPPHPAPIASSSSTERTGASPSRQTSAALASANVMPWAGGAEGLGGSPQEPALALGAGQDSSSTQAHTHDRVADAVGAMPPALVNNNHSKPIWPGVALGGVMVVLVGGISCVLGLYGKKMMMLGSSAGPRGGRQVLGVDYYALQGYGRLQSWQYQDEADRRRHIDHHHTPSHPTALPVAKTLYEALDGLWGEKDHHHNNDQNNSSSTSLALNSIDVSGRRLDDEDILSLCRALRWGGGGRHESLEVLDLRLNHITSNGTRALARALSHHCCPNLKRLSLEFNQLGAGNGSEGALWALAQALPYVPHLQVLELGGNQLTAQAALLLAEGLGAPGACGELRVLDLFDNRLETTGLLGLARAAPACPQLTHLDVRVNWVNKRHLAGIRLLSPIRWSQGDTGDIPSWTLFCFAHSPSKLLSMWLRYHLLLEQLSRYDALTSDLKVQLLERCVSIYENGNLVQRGA